MWLIRILSNITLQCCYWMLHVNTSMFPVSGALQLNIWGAHMDRPRISHKWAYSKLLSPAPTSRSAESLERDAFSSSDSKFDARAALSAWFMQQKKMQLSHLLPTCIHTLKNSSVVSLSTASHKRWKKVPVSKDSKALLIWPISSASPQLDGWSTYHWRSTSGHWAPSHLGKYVVP